MLEGKEKSRHSSRKEKWGQDKSEFLACLGGDRNDPAPRKQRWRESVDIAF